MAYRMLTVDLATVVVRLGPSSMPSPFFLSRFQLDKLQHTATTALATAASLAREQLQQQPVMRQATNKQRSKEASGHTNTLWASPNAGFRKGAFSATVQRFPFEVPSVVLRFVLVWCWEELLFGKADFANWSYMPEKKLQGLELLRTPPLARNPSIGGFQETTPLQKNEREYQEPSMGALCTGILKIHKGSIFLSEWCHLLNNHVGCQDTRREREREREREIERERDRDRERATEIESAG